MSLTHRQRIETAWSFREGDRVPVEMHVSARIRQDPRAARLVALTDEHADCFLGAPGPSFGFLGFPSRYEETVIEDRPGEYTRRRRVHHCAAGTFTAITYHPAGIDDDYHWDKRFITTQAELAAIADTPRPPGTWDRAAYLAAVAQIGERGLPCLHLYHPLGALVRLVTMDDMYEWFRSAPALVHRFLAAANAQVRDTLAAMAPAPDHRFTFVTYAHEMFIPPWMGHRLFDEFVAPYDRELFSVVRQIGGRVRAHVHGRCMDFLEQFADLGIGATEPLEPPPFGDVDLAAAKQRVGDRLLLCGNVPSQAFVWMTPAQVRAHVREAIRVAGRGGGFALHPTGGALLGSQVDMPPDQAARVIANYEAYLDAALEFGRYPLPPA